MATIDQDQDAPNVKLMDDHVVKIVPAGTTWRDFLAIWRGDHRYGPAERESCTLSLTNELLDQGATDTFVRLLSIRKIGDVCTFVLERALCGSLFDIAGDDEAQDVLGTRGLIAVYPSAFAHSVACRVLLGAYILRRNLYLAHNDLHPGNVLLTPCVHDMAKYTITSPTGTRHIFRIPTFHVRVMIADFGTASVSYVDHVAGISQTTLENVLDGSLGADMHPTPFTRFSDNTDVSSVVGMLYGCDSPQFLAAKSEEHNWKSHGAELVVMWMILNSWAKLFEPFSSTSCKTFDDKVTTSLRFRALVSSFAATPGFVKMS